MKTIEELKSASLVELAENEKEWKIRRIPTVNSWFRMIIFREQVKGLPECIRICNRFQWMLAKLVAWAKKQNTCKMWAMASGIATGISFAAILMMTIADVPLADQIWAIVIWAISAFIFTLSTVKLF